MDSKEKRTWARDNAHPNVRSKFALQKTIVNANLFEKNKPIRLYYEWLSTINKVQINK